MIKRTVLIIMVVLAISGCGVIKGHREAKSSNDEFVDTFQKEGEDTFRSQDDETIDEDINQGDKWEIFNDMYVDKFLAPPGDELAEESVKIVKIFDSALEEHNFTRENYKLSVGGYVADCNSESPIKGKNGYLITDIGYNKSQLVDSPFPTWFAACDKLPYSKLGGECTEIKEIYVLYPYDSECNQNDLLSDRCEPGKHVDIFGYANKSALRNPVMMYAGKLIVSICISPDNYIKP